MASHEDGPGWKFYLAVLLPFLAVLWAVSPKGAACIKGDYKVAEADPARSRIAIAISQDASDWLYVRPETQFRVHRYLGHGLFHDEYISSNVVWSELKAGRDLLIHGGRDADGELVARQIYLTKRPQEK